MLRRVILFAACIALPCIAAADVYKYTDPNGKVQYTDKPQTLPAEKMSVASQRTDNAAIAKRTQEDSKKTAEQNKVQQNAAAKAADEKNAQTLSATDKAEKCVKARERYDQYTNARRLYETDANGERRYLSDAEIDAARAAAKASMDTLCQ